MENYVKVSKEVFAPIIELVRIGLFRDEKDALTGIIREQARNKIRYYDGKVSELERKYRVDFREFKRLLRVGRTKKYLRNATTSYGGRGMKRRCDTGLRSRRGSDAELNDGITYFSGVISERHCHKRGSY